MGPPRSQSRARGREILEDLPSVQTPKQLTNNEKTGIHLCYRGQLLISIIRLIHSSVELNKVRNTLNSLFTKMLKVTVFSSQIAERKTTDGRKLSTPAPKIK